MTKEAAISHWRPDPIKNQAKSSACIGQQLEKSDSWFTAAGESEFLLGINGNPAQIQLSRRLIWPRMHRMPYYLPISLQICLNLDDVTFFYYCGIGNFSCFWRSKTHYISHISCQNVPPSDAICLNPIKMPSSTTLATMIMEVMLQIFHRFYHGTLWCKSRFHYNTEIFCFSPFRYSSTSC